MKFYIAGKFEEMEEVRKLQQALRNRGHEITKDWTYDYEDEEGFPEINVVEDIYGVSQADAFVGLFIKPLPYGGSLVEMGAALALRKRVYVIGHGIDICIFTQHPLIKQFDTVEDFLNGV